MEFDADAYVATIDAPAPVSEAAPVAVAQPEFDADRYVGHIETVQRTSEPFPSPKYASELLFPNPNTPEQNKLAIERLGNKIASQSKTPFSDAASVMAGEKSPLVDPNEPIVKPSEIPKDIVQKYPKLSGVNTALAEFASGLTTPNNIKLMIGLGSSPALIQKLASLGFAAEGIKAVSESVGAATVETDESKKAQLVASAVVNAVMATAMAKHAAYERAVTPEQQKAAQMDLDKWISQRKTQNTIPKLNEVGATKTAQALEQTTKPKEGDINEQKQSSGTRSAEGAVVDNGGQIPVVEERNGDGGTKTPDSTPAPAIDNQRQEGGTQTGVLTKVESEGSTPTDSTSHGEQMAQDLGIKYSGEQEGANGAKLHTYSVPIGEGAETSLTVKPDVTQAELRSKIEAKQAEFGYEGGPGAMGPVEAAEMKASQGRTSVKNRVVDEERAKRGELPLMEPARKAMGKTWDEAMARIDADPKAGENLAKDIREGKKKDISEVDQAVLLHHKIDVTAERNEAARRALDPESTAEERAQASLDYARLEDQANEIDQSTQQAGTISGRALQIRQLMVAEDYSVSALEKRLRMAKGGKPLTIEETAKIKELSGKIADLEKKLAEREGTSKQRGSDEASTDAVNRLKNEARTQKKGDPKSDRESLIDKLKNRIKDGGNIKDLSSYVQKIALQFVREGVKERGALVDAVHGVLKDIVPDITKRETQDAISGYGDFKQLSKDEIKVQLRDLKGQLQQVSKLEDLEQRIPPKKTGVERRIPSDEERDLIKKVNDLTKELGLKVTDPETQLRSALQSFKTRTKNRITDLQKKIDAGDFSKTPRREIKLDAEALKLKSDASRVKRDFDRGVMNERLKNRTFMEKAMDVIPKISRMNLLSSPVTLAKLTMAALYRFGITPIEEIVGTGFSKAFPSLAARAPREGGGSVRIEAKALADAFTKGMKDSWDTLTGKGSEIELAYGKQDILPHSWMDFFGHMHGALKAPVKRAEFSRSFQKRVAHAINNGVDASDPFVQTKLAIEAYKDANRSIFMQDNRVVNAYKAGMRVLENPDKETGKIPVSAKLASSAIKTLLPIVKVPTNIVAETLQYATGSITGSIRLAKAFHEGVSKLHPSEADLIMRELKKGSIGGAVLLLGYFAPQVIGGYYQRGEKRDANDIKSGSIKVYDTEIPPLMLHAPIMEILQMGSTIRRVGDKKGLPAGVAAAGLGLTESVPFIKEQIQNGKLFNPSERGKYLGELAKSRIDPAIIQWIARQMDREKEPEGIMDYINPKGVKRDPKTIMEFIESGLPVLNKSVPEKVPHSSGGSSRGRERSRRR